MWHAINGHLHWTHPISNECEYNGSNKMSDEKKNQPIKCGSVCNILWTLNISCVRVISWKKRQTISLEFGCSMQNEWIGCQRFIDVGKSVCKRNGRNARCKRNWQHRKSKQSASNNNRKKSAPHRQWMCPHRSVCKCSMKYGVHSNDRWLPCKKRSKQ